MPSLSNRPIHIVFRLRTLAISISLLTVPSLVAAQAVQQSALDSITVPGDWIGNPTADDAKEYSGSRTVLDSKRMLQRCPLSLEDALRSSPTVQVLAETGPGILPKIGLRGLNP